MHKWQIIRWAKLLFSWSADSEAFSDSPFKMFTFQPASSHSSVFPTLTGAAGDNFSLSSDSSASKSLWQYCLTWLPLTGIFGTIFLCFEIVIAFFPAGWAWILNQVQNWQLALLACSSPCGCRNKGGAASRNLIKHSEQAWNKKFVILYLYLNHSKLMWKKVQETVTLKDKSNSVRVSFI